MFSEGEFQFLCDTFKKSRVSVNVISCDEPMDLVYGQSLEPMISNLKFASRSLNDCLDAVTPQTVYKISDDLGLLYSFFLLPDEAREGMVFIVGPFTHKPFTPRQVLELGESFGVSPKYQKIFTEYISSIPVLPENSHAFVMLDTFVERMWESTSYAAVDVDKELQFPISIINESSEHTELDDVIVKMKLMEKRYSFENELLSAVTLGQMNKISLLLNEYSELSFEKRATDPLRNIRNYCIITNTLLRKAAEQGGVHPLYLDNLSGSFAHRIEQTASSEECTGLIGEMFRSYCRLVRKHSLKKYSPIVQKVMLFVDSDISANLTLSSLSKVQNVTPGYLSTVFKKETGKTVTEYITEKRIKHAAHLLCTTHLQIQTIALHCGIMDVQYFSKLFKKNTGMTPKEYREAHK